MLKQSFVVIPQGIIKSGTVDYLIDEKVGNGTASYDVMAGFLWIEKQVRGSGAFKADPEQFKSANVTKDKVIIAGDTVLTVLDVDRKVATVGIALKGAGVSGTAQLNLSKEYISVMHASVSGNVMGYDITVEIQPA